MIQHLLFGSENFPCGLLDLVDAGQCCGIVLGGSINLGEVLSYLGCILRLRILVEKALHHIDLLTKTACMSFMQAESVVVERVLACRALSSHLGGLLECHPRLRLVAAVQVTDTGIKISALRQFVVLGAGAADEVIGGLNIVLGAQVTHGEFVESCPFGGICLFGILLEPFYGFVEVTLVVKAFTFYAVGLWCQFVLTIPVLEFEDGAERVLALAGEQETVGDIDGSLAVIVERLLRRPELIQCLVITSLGIIDIGGIVKYIHAVTLAESQLVEQGLGRGDVAGLYAGDGIEEFGIGQFVFTDIIHVGDTVDGNCLFVVAALNQKICTHQPQMVAIGTEGMVVQVKFNSLYCIRLLEIVLADHQHAIGIARQCTLIS